MKNEQTGDVIREFTIKAADLPATKKQNFTIKGTQVDLNVLGLGPNTSSTLLHANGHL
jgi:hypothetical protein